MPNINKETIVAGILSTGALTVLVITLGRLWTRSYYDTFGLPTSDLSLRTEDYAFQAKEALVMVAVAAIVAAGLWWRKNQLHLTENRNLATLPRWFLAVSSIVLALFVLFRIKPPWLGTFVVWVDETVIERFWVQTAVLLGVLIGLVVGLLVVALAAINDPREKRGRQLVMAASIIGIVTLYLPFAVEQLAQASASQTMGARNLAHAVVEFEDVAPAAIRREDDDTRSVRVYVVLSTPDHLAVAFPYPCRHITTAGAGEIELEAIDLEWAGEVICDTVVFARDRVKAVRVLGRGGRPSNDEPGQADAVELAAEPTNGEVRERIVYQQAFDFAEARPFKLTCEEPANRNDEKENLKGVWLRLTPQDTGWVSIEGSPDQILRAPVDQPNACVVLDKTIRQLKVAAGRDQLVYLYSPATRRHDVPVRRVVIRYMPLATVVELTDGSQLHVEVEVALTEDDKKEREGEGEEWCPEPAPTIAAPGVEGVPRRCDSATSETVTFFFEPVTPAPAGSVTVRVCSGDEHTDGTDERPRIKAIRVTAIPVETTDEPTPPDEANGTGQDQMTC